MRKQLIVIALALSAIYVISCAPAAQSPSIARAPLGVAPPLPPSGGADAAVKQAQQPGQYSPIDSSAASVERMIVRTVRLGLEVQDTEKAFNDIGSIATANKGYIAQTSLARDSKNRLVGNVTLRIPADSLDAAMKQIKAAGLKVLSENSNANDVTDQYTDLNARLKNLQATEDELRKMMDTVRERSTKAEDVLAVYRELTNIRTQIEQLKGQINVIDRTTSLATVTIELVPHEDVQVLDPETWAPNRTAAQALRALLQALQGLGSFVIWLGLFVLPLFVVLALPFVALLWIVRTLMRRRGKNKSAPAS